MPQDDLFSVNLKGYVRSYPTITLQVGKTLGDEVISYDSPGVIDDTTPFFPVPHHATLEAAPVDFISRCFSSDRVYKRERFQSIHPTHVMDPKQPITLWDLNSNLSPKSFDSYGWRVRYERPTTLH